MSRVAAHPHGSDAQPQPPRFRLRLREAIDHARATSDADDAGFSLIEVVVALTIFAVVIGGAVVGLNTAFASTHYTQQRVDAANAAQGQLAAVVSAWGQPGAAMPRAITSSSPLVVTLPNEQFTVTQSVSATSCSVGSSFTVHVEVRQKQAADRSFTAAPILAQTDTVIAC